MRTACGHLFCADCIFRSAIEVPDCPTCDTPADYSDIKFFTKQAKCIQWRSILLMGGCLCYASKT
ncbi:hypothetical protein BpHYR1_025501 [Brachionus plicatilis]|uniref:RING-type domain-containing protein n=1 Tax=Brachionus plicatilis TaxID=10195 RepID=A0A3M7PIR9_BRAPC|nr:hypothetical protein BpHYR1_025501 [Brachionus plicatilis]